MPRTAARNAALMQTSFDDARPMNDTRSLCAAFLRWEICRPHMYVDARGFVATGLGHALLTAEAAIALPWRHRATGRPATPVAIRQAFARIRAIGPRQTTLAHRLASDLVLPAGFAGNLAIGRIERNVLPGVRRLCPRFDRYPLPARRALVDIACDRGLAALARFRTLLAACARGDFAAAADHCHRRGGCEPRNAATRALFLEAATVAATFAE